MLKTNNTQPARQSDWRTSDWAQAEISRADALGLIPDRLVGEDLTKIINRAEFAAVCIKLYEVMSGRSAMAAAESPFTDTTDADVLLAYGTGLTNGITETDYEPETLLNREQAATPLTRAFKKNTMTGWSIDNDAQFPLRYEKPAAFTDDALISGYAYDSVYFMAANKIINGMPDGNAFKYAPRNATEAEEAIGYANATREVAMILAVRMAENLGR